MTAVERLFALEQFGIKLGLDNIRTILAALGNPERQWKSIHIAGTNGKGSVTAMVHASLVSSGIPAARFTSPHLVDSQLSLPSRQFWWYWAVRRKPTPRRRRMC